MLTGDYEAIPGEGNLTDISRSKSISNAFASSFDQAFKLVPFIGEQKRKEINDKIEVLNLTLQHAPQDTFGSVSNWIAGAAGSILNPISLAAGGAAGAAIKPVVGLGTALVGDAFPSSTALLSKAFPSLPDWLGKESASSLAGHAATGYAVGAGALAPQEIAETYDPKTDKFDVAKGLEMAAYDGGIGMALPAGAAAAGVIWGKVFKGVSHEAMSHVGIHPREEIPTGVKKFDAETQARIDELNKQIIEKGQSGDKAGMNDARAQLDAITAGQTGQLKRKLAPNTISDIDKAVEAKEISKEQAQYLKDYLTGEDTHENLASRGTDMLIKEGQPVDAATKQMMFKMVAPENVNNFQTGLADSVASKMPENVKPLYNHFIGHDSIDSIFRNQGTLDGLSGVISFINRRLETAPEDIAKLTREMKKLLPEIVKEKNPISQTAIFNAERRAIRTGQAIPENVERRITQHAEIKVLNQKLDSYTKEFAKTGNKRYANLMEKTTRRIEHVKGKLAPLLSHKQEIDHIRNKLIPDGQVIDNYKSSRPYRRLLDLTAVRNSARQLMHEVNLRNEYQMHEAYATVLKTITDVMKSDFGKLAKPEAINQYMRERIQHASPELQKIEFETTRAEVDAAEVKLEEQRRADSSEAGVSSKEEVFKEEAESMAKSENKEEFEEVRAKMDEFKASQNILTDLINCIRGV